MSLECWQEAADDYERLLENDEGYDVIIYAGENKNVEEFHALSNILRIRSQYFRNELTKENVEKKDGKFILKITNISPQIFKTILRFIYCGKVDLMKLEGSESLKLLVAADALYLQTLVPKIEEYLINNHHDFLQRNPMETLEIIYQHESFVKLCNFYLEKICEDPESLFNSDKFIGIKAPLLELLLKRDDLCLEEIDIWDSLIKWSFAQNPSIPKDVNKWNKEETTIMERTLHRYIPLIRFHHISSEDFFEKVLPFRELLSKEMFNIALAFYLAPNKKLNIDIQPSRQSKDNSVLIKSLHFAKISSWIDEKVHRFNLIYRASRDGNSQAAFHLNCDNKGATIAVIKIKGTEQIIGGYNPLEWDSNNKWKTTADSFIFAFKNGTDLQISKVGYSNMDQTFSIGCFLGYGPLFGRSDLRCENNNLWTSHQDSYSRVEGIPTNFDVDDYEVFRVIKN